MECYTTNINMDTQSGEQGDNTGRPSVSARDNPLTRRGLAVNNRLLSHHGQNESDHNWVLKIRNIYIIAPLMPMK